MNLKIITPSFVNFNSFFSGKSGENERNYKKRNNKE